MTRRSLFGFLVGAVTPACAKVPTPTGADVCVEVSGSDFIGATIIDGATVGNQVLVDMATRPQPTLSVWLTSADVPRIERQNREIHGQATFARRPLGSAADIPRAPDPPKLNRLLDMPPEQRIDRMRRIERLSPGALATAIHDTEIDIALWRSGGFGNGQPTAEQTLERIESRLRIWVDRYVETL